MGRPPKHGKKTADMLCKMRAVPLPECETRNGADSNLKLPTPQTASRAAITCSQTISNYLRTSSFDTPIFAFTTAGFQQAFHGSAVGRLQQYILAKATERGLERRKNGESLRNLVIQRAPGAGKDEMSVAKKWENAITDYIQCSSLKSKDKCMQNIVSSASHAAQVTKKRSAITTHMRGFGCDLVTKKAAVFYFMESFLFEHENTGLVVAPQCKRYSLVQTFSSDIDYGPMSAAQITELEQKTTLMLQDSRYAPPAYKWFAHSLSLFLSLSFSLSHALLVRSDVLLYLMQDFAAKHRNHPEADLVQNETQSTTGRTCQETQRMASSDIQRNYF
jgi:hypothetical protein